MVKTSLQEMSILLLVLFVAWSCVTVLCFTKESTTSIECNKPVITQCECGGSGHFHDFYVTSCVSIDNTNENSSYCGPCPGSCLLFMLCKTCWKNGCLSCSPGRRGQFCEIELTSEAGNLNHTEVPVDKMKSYTQELIDRQATFDSFPLHSADTVSSKNLSPEKLAIGPNSKSKLMKNKNYRNKIAVIDGTTFTVIDKNETQSKNANDRSETHYADVFDSNVHPVDGHSYSNETQKLTSIQNPKETLTVLHGLSKVNDNDGFPITPIKYENKTDINNKLIDPNYLFMNKTGYINQRVRNSLFKNIIFSKNGYSKEGNFEAFSNVRLNTSSNQFRFPFEYPMVPNNSTLDENERLNSSSNQWRFPFEYPEVHYNDTLEENEWTFAKTSNRSESPKINPTMYRSAFDFDKSEPKEENISRKSTSKQSNSSEILSESSKIQNPFNASIFKVKIIDPERFLNNEDADCTSESRDQFELDKTVKFPEKPEDQISKNSSKKFEPLNPLEIDVFNVTFLDKESSISKQNSNTTETRIIENGEKTVASQTSQNEKIEIPENPELEPKTSIPIDMIFFRLMFSDDENNSSNNNQNSNTTESRIIKNDEKTNASQTSQNETFELPEDITLESDAANPLNVSEIKVSFLKENTGIFSNEEKQNSTLKLTENNTEANLKERTANYKRNASSKSNDEQQYDLDGDHKTIMQSPYLSRSKLRKPDDEQLYRLHTFNRVKMPENHILRPLYFPQMFNAKRYRSSISDNGHLQLLCQLYPNYSPCYRSQMPAPGIPYGHAFGFQSQIYPNYHQHERVPIERFKNISPEMTYEDYEGNMNILSYDKKSQQPLTDSRTLGLGKQYFQFKKAPIASWLPLQSSGNIFIAEHSQRPLIQEIQSKEGLDATSLSGIINHLFSLIFPKYSGTELASQAAILNQQDLYHKRPVETSEEIELPLDANPPIKARFFINTYSNNNNSPFGVKYNSNKLPSQSAFFDQQYLYKKGSEQPVETNEEIDLPLDSNPPLKARYFIKTYSNNYNSPFVVKYNSNKLPAQSAFLDQQYLYKKGPEQSVETSKEMDLPLDINPTLTDILFPGQHYNRSYSFSKTREGLQSYYKNTKIDSREYVDFTKTKMEPKPINPEYESIQMFLNIPSELEEPGISPFKSNITQWGISKHETPEGFIQKRRVNQSNYTSNEIKAYDMKDDDGKIEYSFEESDDSIQNEHMTSKVLPGKVVVKWNMLHDDGKMEYSSQELDHPIQNKNTMSKNLPEKIMVKWNMLHDDGKTECSLEESDESLQNEKNTSELHSKTADTVRQPMFAQFSLENGTEINEKNNFLQSDEDKPFESCTMCVLTESFYSPVDGEQNPGKSMPTIFRTLIIKEEDQLLGNKSDTQITNTSRAKRSTFYTYGTDEWCPIQRKMLYGDLDCTIWSYQKACTILCHPGYTTKSRTFRCSRRTNTWNPQICACQPFRPYNGLGYRQGNDSYNDDDLKFLSDALGNNENTGNYNDASVNTSSLFDSMNIDNPDTRFPHSEPDSLERQYDRSNHIINTSLEFNGNSEFDPIQSLSNNTTLDVKMNSKFPVKDLYGNSSNNNNVQGFPGYEAIDGRENKGFPREDGRSISKSDDIPDFSSALTANKDIQNKVAPQDEMQNAKRLFDMYEKNKSIVENGSDQSYQSPEKNAEKNSPASDMIYTFFEKQAPEPENSDSW